VLPQLTDARVAGGLRPVAWLATALPLLVGVFIVREALPALHAYGAVAFLTDGRWAPTSGAVGLGPMVAGTVVSSVLALGLAAPWALAYAIHVNHFAPRWFAAPARGAVAVLAGIPSVVFGFLSLTRLVPLIVADHPPGLGLGVTVLTLTAMIVPTAALAADAAVRQVPAEAALAVRALGLGAWDAVRAAVLPLARPGIRAGLLLALGRAVGETMAVLMVAGNTVQYPTGPFVAFRTLTGNVAVEMAYATGVHRAALFVSALVLLGLVGGVLALRREAA
jgi:phosphate transport system permease protein